MIMFIAAPDCKIMGVSLGNHGLVDLQPTIVVESIYDDVVA